jgi:hypothetical protein
MVELEVKDRGPTFEIASNANLEEMGINIKEMLPAMFGGARSKRSMRVAEALDYLVQEEEQKLIDMDQVTRIALERVESSGIIFLDEIDKIAGREGGHGPDVSREGVQRDILPIVEGTTVNTRHGFVRTDHILFIAAGAFHVSKPSDLIPELQGRFPHPRGAEIAHGGRFRAHPQRAEERAGQAVHGAAGDRRHQAQSDRRRAARSGEIRRAGERIVRKYRRAAPAHHHGESCSKRFPSKARTCARRTSRWMRPMCANNWPIS